MIAFEARPARVERRAALAVGVVVLVAAWEALPRLGLVPSIILPPPTSIVQAGVHDFPSYLDGLKVTVLESLAAIAVAWVVGVVLGAVVGASRLMIRLVVPLLDSAFALPWIVLYPLFLIWLGIGSPSKIAFGVITAIFPVLLTTAAAVSTVDHRYVMLAHGLGASRLQLFTKILLPSALPQIVAGLRVGAGLAIIGVVVGEMLTSLAGLGYLITTYRSTFEAGHVYFAVALALALAGVANAGLAAVEHRFSAWRRTG